MNVDTHSYLAGSDFIDIQAFARKVVDPIHWTAQG